MGKITAPNASDAARGIAAYWHKKHGTATRDTDLDVGVMDPDATTPMIFRVHISTMISVTYTG